MPIAIIVYRNKRLRDKVKESSEGFCASCRSYDAKGEADHILALWNGGDDALDNMQWLCRRCHEKKTVGDIPLRAKTDRLRAKHEQMKRRKPVRA